MKGLRYYRLSLKIVYSNVRIEPRHQAQIFNNCQYQSVAYGGQPTEDVSYYLSNAPGYLAADGAGLCAAIRGHWRVETMHYRHDVVLAEDALRTEKVEVSRLMSSLRILTMNLLHRLKPKNMAAQLDSFADNFSLLLQFMKTEAVL